MADHGVLSGFAHAPPARPEVVLARGCICLEKLDDVELVAVVGDVGLVEQHVVHVRSALEDVELVRPPVTAVHRRAPLDHLRLEGRLDRLGAASRARRGGRRLRRRLLLALRWRGRRGRGRHACRRASRSCGGSRGRARGTERREASDQNTLRVMPAEGGSH